MAHRGKSKNGTRKYGRCLVKCAAYKARHQRERNKIRKLTRLIKRQPHNLMIPRRIEELRAIL